ncbi:MAG: hypothetical protein J4215_03600 [Candidatus Diapherotrites archaeon]|uniref:Uncharacterized protein n=1 Tax=Candidatus Iainarchaeum sp. TaxID=3101447 RepID=A0A8T4L6W8_9ARCH|nr:hypothetical protein [Candidatus Diapherotrites archaeon]
MLFDAIYKLGRQNNFFPRLKSIDEKMELIACPYNSSDIISGILIFGGVFGLFGFLMLFLLSSIPLIGWVILFYDVVIMAAAFVYITSVYYAQRIIDYKEEMLVGILEIANYISLDTSIDYAIQQTNMNLHGVLHDQFEIMLERIQRKKYKTIGEGFEDFIPIWLKVNPDFVKGLSLLQTATLSAKEEREKIILEVIETIIVAYHQSGKRFAEELSSQTQTMIGAGVIFPIMMLMLTPMISIFMPDFITLPMLIFIFNIFFPTILLMMAMQFAANRVQISAIQLDRSPDYRRIPTSFYAIPVVIVGIFLIPTILHFLSLSQVLVINKEYSFENVVKIWTSTLGITIGVGIISWMYVNTHKKLWQRIHDIEADLPHLLQVFATYLSLNRSVESIMDDVIDDYKKHGLQNHPVTGMFSEMRERLYRTKDTMMEIVKNVLPTICPSKRVTSVFDKIVSFSDIDQASAAKSAKLIREQTISIYKLDDYIQTLLADTGSLVQGTITILIPLLASASVIMTMAIVMSLTFIEDKLAAIFELFGGHFELGLIKVDKIIPPTILEFVVGIYFLEMVLILSLFLSNVKHGTDKFKIAESVLTNTVMAFIIYSSLLLIGYFVFREFVFVQILGAAS